MKPIVAIVGRPNVGKSTLFNRLIQQRLAIIENEPGITRDRIYGESEWNGRPFTVVDTGGILRGDGEPLVSQIRNQAEQAMADADVILFLVDARTGVNPLDQDVADLLRRTGKPVVLVANKVENLRVEEESLEFYALGLGQPWALSAAHGLGTGDLLDHIVSLFPPAGEEAEEPEDSLIKIAVIGRPNVGKSSLVNALLGQERMIVSDLAGTTRDAVDAMLEKDGRRYLLIDTAGLRRKGKIEEAVERYSVLRSLRAVDRSDVVLLVLDASFGIAEQDKRIAGYVEEQGKALILMVNKWDLVAKDDRTMDQFRTVLKKELAFVGYAPSLFISALTQQRVQRVLPLVDEVMAAYSFKASTGVLNQVIEEAMAVSPPPPGERSKRLKIYYVTQGGTRPPIFLCFANDPHLMPAPYRRYLESKLREAFPLEGTPIRLVMKARERE
ncbi:MAG: ribosome biogenesis GTPase Der [Firmicutes bacterium]|nr:ribosome biogenesis GTPase Der [Bacillota bacterium]